MGMETCRRPQDGNGDGNGDGNENSSGDGDVNGNGDGDEDGIGESGEETKKRKKLQKNCGRTMHFYSARVVIYADRG